MDGWFCRLHCVTNHLPFPSQDVDLLRVRGAGLELAVVPGADFVVASVQAAEG